MEKLLASSAEFCRSFSSIECELKGAAKDILLKLNKSSSLFCFNLISVLMVEMDKAVGILGRESTRIQWYVRWRTQQQKIAS